jgi:hypothetical protein
MFRVIDAGHIYEIQNRCEKGFLIDSWQRVDFLKIVDDGVDSAGLFSQDLFEILIDRIKWQTENTPYPVADIERNRANALFHLKEALSQWTMFTNERLANGAKLLGHVK